MAKEYVLVPANELARLRKMREQESSNAPAQAIPNIIRTEEHDKTFDYDFILDLLPKSYRARAKLVLHYLKPELAPNGRIKYSDGEGSHIIDLLKWALAPANFNRRQPVDAEKFHSLLRASGVPESAYNANIPSENVAWLTFE